MFLHKNAPQDIFTFSRKLIRRLFLAQKSSFAQDIKEQDRGHRRHPKDGSGRSA
jgi:hypothetical protein